MTIPVWLLVILLVVGLAPWVVVVYLFIRSLFKDWGTP